ncbi:MAG: dTDP-4-dehydrorhamnose 3,5-epimerase [Pseudonocardiales bacterium]|nr:dTDP-4-dehydrorhamnose 3,5-epimerase [Pseudonocardiales bacterium]
MNRAFGPLSSANMHTRPLKIDGAWEFTPRAFSDDRGVFLEWFKAEVFADTVGHPLTVAQANQSVSARGVLRGLHYAAVPPSQAKYVYCPQGAVLDVVVDIRVGSPTFGEWDAVQLDDVDRRAVYVAEGLGHAFMSLADGSAVTYLCSTGYNPAGEFGTDPLDAELGLPWPADIAPILSAKDAAAPSLREAQAQGLLPTLAACEQLYATLRS